MAARRPRGGQLLLLPAALLCIQLLLATTAAAFVLPSSCRAQPPPPSARRPAATAAAAAPSDGAAADEPIYHGFWRDGLSMLQNAFPTTLERVDDLPVELTRAECALPTKGGKQGGKTVVEVHAFRVPGVIRMARAAVLITTPATLPPQVLNFVIFPDPSLDVPIFGADLVQLPGGHLIVLDFQPVAPSSPPSNSFETRLAALHAQYASVLSSGGALPEAAQPFFSPSFLFTRLDAGVEGTEAVRTTVRAAYLDYLGLYLATLKEAAGVSIKDTERAAVVKRGHAAYATYRAENDPARGMLARMFGAEWTERLIHEVLFDWAERPMGKA